MRIKLSTKQILQALGSSKFFYFVIIFFVLQAGWIARVGLYPQAFDEQYHFGIIKLHAAQWSPFFAMQPDGADQYGAVVRDPSMLYHYLFSFPLRVIQLFTSNEMTQIIVLRFLNVALAVWGLFLLRRLLLKVGVVKPAAQVLLFFFTLLPVFPLLSGQLNYDNLLIPVTTLTLLWTINIYTAAYASKRLDWFALGRLFVVMLLFATVKYPYLPILFAVTLLFLPLMWRYRTSAVSSIRTRFLALGKSARAGYVVLLIVSGWLFAGGIGLNLIRYHTPDPSCNRVITVEQCRQFGPFDRDYDSKQRGVHPSVLRSASFPYRWGKNMMRETFFSVYSNFDTNGKVTYHGGKKIPQLIFIGWFWFWVSVIAFIVGFKRLWRQPITRVLVVVGLVYAAAVFYVNARLFYSTTYMAAVHGRYLFPVIVPLLGCALLIMQDTYRKLKAPQKRLARRGAIAAVAITVLWFTQGGGLMTYVYLGQDVYFWPNDSFAQHSSDTLRNLFSYMIIH